MTSDLSLDIFSEEWIAQKKGPLRDPFFVILPCWFIFLLLNLETGYLVSIRAYQYLFPWQAGAQEDPFQLRLLTTLTVPFA